MGPVQDAIAIGVFEAQFSQQLFCYFRTIGIIRHCFSIEIGIVHEQPPGIWVGKRDLHQ